MGEPDEEDKDQETPDGFIEEGGVIAHTVYYLGPGKVSLNSMGFFVEEVAPAADSLSQSKDGSAEIQHVEEIFFVYAADGPDSDDAQDDTSVDGQTAVSGVDDLFEISGVHGPIEDHIICSGADDGCRNEPDDQIQERLRTDAEFGSPLVGYYSGQNEAQSYEDSVPHYVDTEYAKTDSAR